MTKTECNLYEFHIYKDNEHKGDLFQWNQIYTAWSKNIHKSECYLWVVMLHVKCSLKVWKRKSEFSMWLSVTFILLVINSLVGWLNIIDIQQKNRTQLLNCIYPQRKSSWKERLWNGVLTTKCIAVGTKKDYGLNNGIPTSQRMYSSKNTFGSVNSTQLSGRLWLYCN